MPKTTLANTPTSAPTSAPVSGPIEALLEQLGSAITGAALPPTPASLYAQLIRIRDEAELLEVRASDRDAKVHAVLAQLGAACDRMEGGDVISHLAPINQRRPFWSGLDLAEADEAALQSRWATIRAAYLVRCDASPSHIGGNQP